MDGAPRVGEPEPEPEPELVLGSSLCIITGASRGLGRSLAVVLAPRLPAGSHLVLVARCGQRLREVERRVREAAPPAGGLRLSRVEADLSGEEGLRRVLGAVSGSQELDGAPERLLLVNNAGSLGDVTKFVVDFTKPSEVTDYLALNFTSSMCLTASLLKAFPKRENLHRVVVNISSLCAIQPFKSWSLYCSGKAAREMMFRVLAAEEPDVRVLNYAPGPLDTDMQKQARSETADHELRQTFATMHQEGQLIDCEDSARKLVNILLRDEFQSGAHIDYYDQ
ncbi:sepiapterin reductase-like [Carcharodon carcharias]|uniref:sepiapterin reductase-like n=1 Tax=Carcharodon carcharias TaxID=13397 RepID=UPI001B7E3EA5|nr:sepiapterin reductase-like [Carcharodon carcharias]